MRGPDAQEAGADSGPGPEAGPEPDCLPAGQDVLEAFLTVDDLGWSDGVDPTGVRVLIGSLEIGDATDGEGVAVDLAALRALRCLQEVHGYVNIEGTTNLTDLSLLTGLRMVVGDLFIDSNTALRSLAGLESLEAASVHVRGNPQLTNVQALHALEEGSIYLERNKLETLPPLQWDKVSVGLYSNGLKDLAGLRGVTELSSLEMYEPALADLQDLSALESAYQLTLSGVPGPDLSALANLRSVYALEVGDTLGAYPGKTPLESLHGLEGLTALGYLMLHSDSLTSLEGLSGVVDVSQSLVISGARLESLEGFDSLRQLTGILELSGIPNATNMSGLERIETVRGLSITLGGEDSDQPAGLPALPALSRVTGDVTLEGTRDLRDLQNLGGLSYVGGNLIIDHNQALIDLRGLSELQRIDGDLAIGFNDALLSLDGLSPTVDLRGRLLVLANSSLPSADAEALAEGTGRNCDCRVYWYSPTYQCTHCDAPCTCVAKAAP